MINTRYKSKYKLNVTLQNLPTKSSFLAKALEIESGFKNDLIEFKEKKLPLIKLERDIATINGNFKEYKQNCRDWKNYWEIKEIYREIFKEYVDMPLAERVVQIANNFLPSHIETIIGIDTGGRGSSRLVKSVFDKVRVNQKLPKTKIYFLNLHEKTKDETLKEYFKKNSNIKKIKNTDFGKILVIDDFKSVGKVRMIFEKFVELAIKNGAKLDYNKKRYVYFFGENSSPNSIRYHPLDELALFHINYSSWKATSCDFSMAYSARDFLKKFPDLSWGEYRYPPHILESSPSNEDYWSKNRYPLFSKVNSNVGTGNKIKNGWIRGINKRISEVSEIAMKYLSSPFN